MSATVPAGSPWWAAFTEAIGPSPSLAPPDVAWASLSVGFATLDR